MVDIDSIRQLVQMMVDNDLVELSLKHGDEELSLRRPDTSEVPSIAAPTTTAHLPPPPGPTEARTPAAPPDEEEVDTNVVKITSPMVGTFYAAASPDTPAFVEVGSEIRPDSVVCIVEAMKVFNEIKAEIGGTIVEILVENGAAVEFGQPLFSVRRR